MWIVDDDGDLFNTDHYHFIHFTTKKEILLYRDEEIYDEFQLSRYIDNDERLTRYYDLVEKLTGERIDG